MKPFIILLLLFCFAFLLVPITQAVVIFNDGNDHYIDYDFDEESVAVYDGVADPDPNITSVTFNYSWVDGELDVHDHSVVTIENESEIYYETSINDYATVTMTTGYLWDLLYINDYSTFNFYGGQAEAGIDVENNAKLLFTGGGYINGDISVGGYSGDTSVLNMTGGLVDGDVMSTGGNAAITVAGGVINGGLWSRGDGNIKRSGGVVNGILRVHNDAEIHLYGTSFSATGYGILANGDNLNDKGTTEVLDDYIILEDPVDDRNYSLGALSGTLLDGTIFTDTEFRIFNTDHYAGIADIYVHICNAPPADITNDCKVNQDDLMALSHSWLFNGLAFSESFDSGDFTQQPWVVAIDDNDADWAIATDPTDPVNTATYGIKCGAITGDQESSIVLLAPAGFDTITFHRKVSSELGYDYLIFYIDDIEQERWSGEQDWAKKSFTLNQNSHTFKWKYIKDFDGDDNDDAAWIDDISLSIKADINQDNIVNLLDFQIMSAYWQTCSFIDPADCP